VLFRHKIIAEQRELEGAGLFRPFRAVHAIGLRHSNISAAAITPGRRAAATYRAAANFSLFQATTYRSNFLQQNVAKLDLRGQHSLRRSARV
jgi:hypothetical protein